MALPHDHSPPASESKNDEPARSAYRGPAAVTVSVQSSEVVDRRGSNRRPGSSNRLQAEPVSTAVSLGPTLHKRIRGQQPPPSTTPVARNVHGHRGRQTRPSRNRPWKRILGSTLLLSAIFAIFRSGFLDNHQPKPWTWTGDVRVDVPVSTLNTDPPTLSSSMLRLQDYAQYVMVAMLRLSDTVELPRGPNQTPLVLDAPGVDKNAILRKSPTDKDPEDMRQDMYRLIAISNLTITLTMMDELTPHLSRAAVELLDLLNRYDSNDYSSVRDGLMLPPAPVGRSIGAASSLWVGLRGFGIARLRGDVVRWTSNLARSHRLLAKVFEAEPDAQPSAIALGRRAPSFDQLMDHYRHRYAPSDAAITLPRLLASLNISSQATRWVSAWTTSISGPSSIMDLRGICRDRYRHGSVWNRTTLEAIASGNCNPDGKKDYVGVLSGDAVRDVDWEFPVWLIIDALNDALCDAEVFLSALGHKVAHVLGITSGLLRQGDLDPKDTAVLRGKGGALDAWFTQFRLLFTAVRLQRPVVVDTASQLLILCRAFDNLEAKLSALHHSTGWWTAHWDETARRIAVDFAVIPQPNDTAAALETMVLLADQSYERPPRAAIELVGAALPGAPSPYGNNSQQWMENLGLRNRG
ncbi:hypothetical protein QBC47DRAFT_441667 [Echria macrotheca]|uniref:Uncharacterized protein n=1 Tax=Echria macrotheca TaxID=438768 RepID=A0AAJ0B3L5_9PEZI|nr:hypothetical protein QBC47DRAFT_441667 [Echria macrotheca]